MNISSEQALLYQKSFKLKEEGNYLEAAKCYERLIELNKGNIYAICNLGVCQRETGEFNKSLEQFDKALSVDPANYNALYEKAICLYRLCDFDSALQLFEKCNQCKKIDCDQISRNFFHIGECYRQLNHFDESIFNYDKANNSLENSLMSTATKTNFINKILKHKCMSLFSLEKYSECLPIVDHLLQNEAISHSDYNSHYIRARCLYHSGNYEEAIDSLNKSLELNPNEPSLYHFIGLAKYQQGKYIESKEMFGKAYGIDNSRLQSYYYIGLCHFKLKENSTAERIFKEIVMKNGDCCIEAMFALGNSLFKDGNYTKAMYYYNKVILYKPDEKVYFNKGLIYLNMNQFEKAIVEFTNAIKSNNDYINGYLVKAHCFLQVKKGKEAIECLGRIKQNLITKEIEAKINFIKGLCYFSTERYEDAVLCYDKVVELEPERMYDVYLNRGNCYLKLGEKEKAEAEYQKFLECLSKEGENEKSSRYKRALWLANERKEESKSEIKGIMEEIERENDRSTLTAGNVLFIKNFISSE